MLFMILNNINNNTSLKIQVIFKASMSNLFVIFIFENVKLRRGKCGRRRIGRRRGGGIRR